MVERAVALALHACDPPVVVVTGAESDRVGGCLVGLDVHIVPNPRWRDGLASSLRAGIGAVDNRYDAVLVLPCDLPRLDASDLDRLSAAWRARPDLPAAARFDGVLGIPAILPAAVFGEIEHATGDHGARNYLRRDDIEVTTVPLAMAGCDVDAPEDLG
jgi:CTP:molybdopterin cytidylyltransferase MocA